MVAAVMAGFDKLDKDIIRRCSHCSHNGHNSRTCPDRGIRLFGVRLTEGAMRKSVSMGNLSHYEGTGSLSSTPDRSESGAPTGDGYMSDDLVQTSSNARERKKGVPWTEEEHRLFLIGLQKLGKGDWRGISRNFVITRTPTQVASHAQKFFIRQSNLSRKRRRSSLFDLSPDHHVIPTEEPVAKTTETPLPVHHLGVGQAAALSAGQFTEGGGSQMAGIPFGQYLLPPVTISELALGNMPAVQEEDMEANSMMDHSCQESEDSSSCLLKSPSNASMLPSCVPLPLNFSLPFLLGLQPPTFSPSRGPTLLSCNIVKPTPTVSTVAIRIDDDPALPQLCLGISQPSSEPASLSLNLEQPSRQSAFHSKMRVTSGNSQSHKGLNAAIRVV